MNRIINLINKKLTNNTQSITGQLLKERFFRGLVTRQKTRQVILRISLLPVVNFIDFFLKIIIVINLFILYLIFLLPFYFNIIKYFTLIL